MSNYFPEKRCACGELILPYGHEDLSDGVATHARMQCKDMQSGDVVYIESIVTPPTDKVRQSAAESEAK